MPVTYADIEDYVKTALTGLGYGATNPDTNEIARSMPMFHPGPFTIQTLTRKSPQSMLFLVLGNGVGLTKEGLFDRRFITVRAIGRQNDFAYAEKLANDVDNILLALDHNHVYTSGSRSLYIDRTGGSPQLVDFDSGDRYHFQTTYIIGAQR